MLENIPSQSTMAELLGQSLFEVWKALCSMIEEKYDIEPVWNAGGRIGSTNINIERAARRFAAYTQKAIALVS